MTTLDYTMYVHTSFRITMSGTFGPILEMLKQMGQEFYDAKVKELTDSIEKDSNLKFMGESNNGFVFIDNPKQLIEVAEQQFKIQNINGRIVKIIISNDESVKKDAPVCIINKPDTHTLSIAETNAEGESLPYEYNVINDSVGEETEKYFYDETHKDNISDNEDEHYDNKYSKHDSDVQ